MQSVGLFYQQSRTVTYNIDCNRKPEQFIAELKLLAKESLKKELREITASQIALVGQSFSGSIGRSVENSV